MIDEPARHRCDRWQRPGHDRLYVTDLRTGEAVVSPYRIGYRDLLTGVDHPTRPQDLVALAAVVDQWERRRTVPGPVELSSAGRVHLAQPA